MLPNALVAVSTTSNLSARNNPVRIPRISPAKIAPVMCFLCTTALASFMGLIIPRLIHHGRGVKFEMATSDIQATKMDSILDTVKSLIPSYSVNAIYKMTSCVAKDTIVLVPFASTTGTIVQNTPIGVKYITVRHLRQWQDFQQESWACISVSIRYVIWEQLVSM